MKTLIAAMALPVLAGCVSLSEDARFTKVEEAVKERVGAETKWARSDGEVDTVRGRVRELLAKPLGPTEADLVHASRWRGPTFSFARLRRGGETEIERGVFLDVLGLLTIPLSTRVSESRLEATQIRAAPTGTTWL